MNNIDALVRITEILNSITQIDPAAVMDDGRDTEDIEQYNRFASNQKAILEAHGDLSDIELDGLESCELNMMWRDAWRGESPSLIESKYNHAVRYANSLITHIKACSSIVDQLKAARLVAGLTQQQVADKMGIAQQSVARLESGSNEPSIGMVERYATALGLRIGIIDDK